MLNSFLQLMFISKLNVIFYLVINALFSLTKLVQGGKKQR